MQGASAEQEAQRLREEVEREQLNVKAALQALEAERARMAARAAAEKQRLLEKVGPYIARAVKQWSITALMPQIGLDHPLPKPASESPDHA